MVYNQVETGTEKNLFFMEYPSLASLKQIVSFN